ncbi:MAG: hypothetical protein ACI8XV_003092 [Arenicella sp.]|jgi:hypothetical protein
MCMIAINFENQYYSIRCKAKDSTRVVEVLQTRINDQVAALRFIAMGDVTFSKTDGLLFDGTHPVLHATPIELANHAVNADVRYMHVFEDNHWSTIPLIRTDAIEMAV